MTFSIQPSIITPSRHRILTSRSALVALVIALLVGTELHFSWIEEMAGAYLLTTNDQRAESGAIWEQGHRNESARIRLHQHVAQREGVRREVRQAASMGQVLEELDQGRGAMISAEHFLTLYRKLPPVVASEIVSPYTLLAHSSSGRWNRAFFELQSDGLAVYLLDARNQVLLRIDIAQDLMEHIRRGEVAIQAGLDQLADFRNHIYPADRFFTALASLPDDVRSAVIAQPGDFLNVSGIIRRVGISTVSMGGAVDIGFEVEDGFGLKVLLTQGKTAAVAYLRRALEREQTLWHAPGAATGDQP